jgi:hypothetical protein
MARFVDYRLLCDEHGCPMIQTGEGYECLFDFVESHLGGLPVTDLVPDNGEDRPGALVFADGHTLPLLCPHCARAAQLDDPASLLDDLGGLTLVALEYADDEDGRNLRLLFAADPEVDLNEDGAELVELATHPESARRLACPAERRARHRRGA